MPDTPRVFLSATHDDLKLYRAAAKEAMLDAGCFPVTMENFPARDRAILKASLDKVDECEAVVVIVGHRYGRIPPEEKATQRSITWCECARARGSKPAKPVLAFVVDETHPWPEEHKETYRATEALNNGQLTPVLTEEIQDAVNQLKEFKRWLGAGAYVKFTTTDSLRRAVLHALNEWKNERGGQSPRQPPPNPTEYDPTRYLDWLRGSTRQIDFRGLRAGKKEVQAYPMDELYIPLMTHPRGGTRAAGAMEHTPVPLETALKENRRLVIQGDAGSGKTTFLRYEAWRMCRPGANRTGFPVLVSIARLDTFIQARVKKDGFPVEPDSPQWLTLYLEDVSKERDWGLDRAFFDRQLRRADTAVLLDGLDEASNEKQRKSMARLFEALDAKYGKCRWVVTTRPGAYEGEGTLKDFATVSILELAPGQIEGFLNRWSLCLRDGDETAAADHYRDLQRALDNSPFEIRRMARNPLMLSALAVVHYNEKKLPDQRAELYECILQWLAKSRPTKEERPLPEALLDCYGYLAFSMQGSKHGTYRTRIGRGRAADLLAEKFNFADAKGFLAQEEVDSGVLTSEGANEIKFYHRTYQEYLAARYLSRLRSKSRWPEVERRIARAEWRETFVLLAGCLHAQGTDVLNEFLEELIAHGLAQEALDDRARVVGLAGSMLGDLRAVRYELSAVATRDYEKLRADVMRIFEPGGAPELGVKTRADVADALGQAGDPRLRLPAEEDYWVKVRGSLAIGRYPVTVYEFAKFVDAGGKKPGKWEEQLRTPNGPVVYVDWDDAEAYCTWVGGVRLPTDDEWTLAAAGSGPQKRAYPWGDDEPDEERANYGDKVGRPTAVGLFPKGNTPEGVADMAGNVWEWTASDYDKTAKSVRGGAFGSSADGLRAAVRSRDLPGYWYGDLGFRLVRE